MHCLGGQVFQGLSTLKDELSFAFGIISLVTSLLGSCRNPTNYHQLTLKSSHGVSLLLLLTWIAGSARSLTGSTTPPIRSYLGPVRSGLSAVGMKNDLSSDDEGNQSSSKTRVSQSKPIPWFVSV
ncbi:Uncharacterized protein Fot_26854 [Forsythia ovata]|uniref:Uncharacterized protein n=1 Tax=Forsythia ovata TaxID=205694 RepID=A0ABD1UD15_9LAMI